MSDQEQAEQLHEEPALNGGDEQPELNGGAEEPPQNGGVESAEEEAKEADSGVLNGLSGSQKGSEANHTGNHEHEAAEEEQVVPTNAEIEWIKSKIDLDEFEMELWPAKYNEPVNSFLESEGVQILYFWVQEEHGLLISRSRPPRLQVDSHEFMYFIKPENLAEPLAVENMDKQLLHGNISKNPLDTLIEYMNISFVPTIKREQRWPQSVKKEFLDHMHSFVGTITETSHMQKGSTILYIPNEDIIDPADAAKDKDLVQRLDTTLIRWTRQINDIVSNQESQQDNENTGPLDEIQYWKLRTVNLSRINDQLNKPDLQRVVTVLRINGSSYLKKFEELASKIENGAKEAEDNLAHLQTLAEPCEVLGKSRPKDIPNIIPVLLEKVKAIWENSAYYNTSDRITRLFKKISNEIINRCIAIIDINDMLGNDVNKCKADLNECKECGTLWERIFDDYFEKDEPKKEYSKSPIFSQVSAFVQRCIDLKEICKGQLQFARKDLEGAVLPPFGGTRGREITENILEIERSFNKQIERIKSLDYNILDVKNTRWHPDFNKFKNKMKHLENMYKNFIDFGFAGVTTVAQGVELLEAFDSLAKRKAIKVHVQKKSIDVFDKFKQDLDLVKKEYDARSKAPLATYHPRYGGAALWFRSLLARIASQKRLLDQLTFIRDPAALDKKEEVFKKYSEDFDRMKTYISNNLYKDWNAEVDLMKEVKEEGLKEGGLQKRMKRRVFSKEGEGPEQMVGVDNKILRRTKHGALTSDFDKGLMKLVAEVKCWEKLQSFGILIPSDVHEVASFREEYRIIKENALLVVRDYNNIMNVLNDKEKNLFYIHIKNLDTKLKPGWTNKIDWSQKAIVDAKIKDWRKQCTDCIDKVFKYKSNTERVYRKCAELSDIPLLSLNRKQVYELDTFEEEQGEHLQQAVPRIQGILDEIMEIIVETFEIFNSVTDLKSQSAAESREKVMIQWREYLQDVDKELEKSFKLAIKHSLSEMNKAINGDTKSETSPIFRLHVSFDEQIQDVLYRPSMEFLQTMIQKTNRRVIYLSQHFTRIAEVFRRESKALAAKADKLTPNPLLAQAMAKGDSLRDDDNPDAEPEEYETFSSFMTDAEIAAIDKKIISGIEKCNALLATKIKVWTSEHFSKVWENNRTTFLKRKKEQKADASSFEEAIKHNLSIIGMVNYEKNSVPVSFVLIDNTEIQNIIKKYCMDWINSITDLVNETAREEMYALYDLFEKTTKELSLTPVDNLHLKRLKDKLGELQGRVNEINREIPPIQRKYELLVSNDVQYPQEESTKLSEIEDRFEEWKEMLQTAEVSLERTSRDFEKEVHKSWKDYEKLVEELFNEFKQNAPFGVENIITAQAKKVITDFKQRVAGLKEREANMKFGINLFGISAYTPNAIGEMEKELGMLTEMWDLKQRWDEQWGKWKNTRFYDLNVDSMTETGNEYIEKLKGMEKAVKEWGVYKDLSSSINTFLNTLPLIQQLSHRAIKDRHWDELKWEIKQQFNQQDSSFTLDTIWHLGLHQYTELIADIYIRAGQQLKIEETIQNISTSWENLNLEVIQHNEFCLKLRYTDAIYVKLEENIVELSTMKSQIHSEPFQEEIAHWEFTLSQINDTIDVLMQVQRQWVDLETIFVGKDQEEFSKKQLTNERTEFINVNDRFMDEMKRIEENPNAKEALCHPGFYDILLDLNLRLEKVNKGLDQFLSMERGKFPRFYFLSDKDLLNILGQGKTPEKVQQHIKKLFEGIKRLDMYTTQKKPEAGERGTRGHKVTEIGSMIAADGETVPLANKVVAEGEVEIWLDQLEKSMQLTLKKQLTEVYKKTAPKDKRPWIQNSPGQLVLTSGQIKWTADVRAAIGKYQSDPEKKNPLKDLLRAQRKYIKSLTGYVREPSSEIERNKLVALITIEQHAREVIQRLIDKNIQSPNDFEWVMQLRFEKEDKPELDYWICRVRQTNTAFEYGYEYQGNNKRLVVTPLTDRCYMTLTTALYLRRGGAPQGPAGTGKTETVKDLGKNMAKFVIVINCSDGLDFSSLGRLFSGFAQSGAWGCLDEFNRIELEVLSVVAQQISTIQTAIRQDAENFKFEGATIPLNVNCGIFITMNPGYAGRSELPDNLKSLFRPISMMYADLQLISEVLLLSEGFEEGGILSKKLVTLYTLMVQQLSKQHHYDFGMRALNAVLSLAGNMKREQAGADEKVLLMKSLHDMNKPKLTSEDLELFLPLLHGIFEGVELNVNQNEDLSRAVRNALEQKNLQPTPMVMGKCMQLFDSKTTRHGNMLVGAAQSGKTTCWQALKAGITTLAKQGLGNYLPVKTNVLNPKAISILELYGWYDSANEWHDGILSNIMKEICEKEGNEYRWLILDGPIDTKWIESMNSVLDDNKLLTLVNGDRISMPTNVRLLFEVDSLAEASPATVSRAGMIYLDVEEQGFMPVYESWTQKKDPETRNFLLEMLHKYGEKVLDLKIKHCNEIVPCMPINLITSLTRIYDVFATGADLEKGDESYWLLLEKWYVFSLIWSVGGSVDEHGRDAIDTLIRDIESGFPHSGLLYDYYVNVEKKDWAPWRERVPPKPTIQPGTPYSKILIPTVDTYRNLELMKNLVKNGHNALAVGLTGCGKTALIATELLPSLDESFTYFTINFSGQTSSKKTQEIIENSLEKRTSNKRGPPGNKHCVLFVDDLNMPRKDEYHSQPPLELLREWCDYGFWYDRQKQQPLFILDLQLVAAMGPPGGGRAEITQRMQSQFNLLNFTLPDSNQMYRIYHTIISHHLSYFDEEVKPLIETFTQATLQLYGRIKEVFLPTPVKSHYTFNTRDVSRVFQGMYRADKNFHDSRENLIKLWVHECLRVFHDRLVNSTDQQTFKDLIEDQLQSGMGMTYSQCCLQVTIGGQTEFKDPIFVDNDLRGNDAEVYDAVDDPEKLREYLNEKLEKYNSSPRNLQMNLVLFKEAIFYLCKIHRVLKQESGHALLVGVGGSGRHSLTRLAAYCADFELVQLNINKNYKHTEFREDLKKMKWTAGVNNKPLVFLFSDNDVVNELFLEDVNNILSAGEVPNIYTSDEIKDIRENMRKPAKQQKRAETPEALYNFFLERVRHNLHICFCISPVGSKFRDYCRVYPGLINNTTISWFMSWPQDALYEVATKFTEEELDFKSSLKAAISDVFCRMHVSVTEASDRMLLELKRHNYVTPTHYLDLVTGYISLLNQKQKQIGDSAEKLRNGLGKLEEAKVEVEQMSKELEVTKNEVSKKQQQCEDLMTQVNQEQTKADKSKKEMEHKSEEIEKEKKGVEAIAAEAEADLAKALPALLEAELALEKLDKREIAEVRAYTAPPKQVETVMEAVLIIISNEKPTWNNAKKELSDPNFINRIKTYNKESMPTKVLKKLEVYTQRADFMPKALESVSQAAMALCQWVHALESYGKTYRDVEPKRQTVNALRSNLKKMEDKLTDLSENLEGLEATIQALDAQLKEQEEERREYEELAKKLQSQLERAEKLVSGLSSERIRWEISLENFEEMYTKLPGDCLVSSGFLSYAGPFNGSYRDELFEKHWLPPVLEHQIPLTQDFSVTNFMVTPTEIREWNLNKLPTDKFSVENGILATRTNRWPLMIDPQQQANTWVKNLERGRLKALNTQKAYMKDLEEAIRTGGVVLLEDIEEEIDPSLDPILKKAIQRRGKTFAIKIGEKEIAYNTDFRLFITTRMTSPHYTPEISTKVTIVNFQVRESGLEEQLLGILVRKEDQRVEDDKDRLVVSMATNNKKIVELEDQILTLLNKSSGSLINDDELILTLQTAKETGEKVKQEIESSEAMIRKIDSMRENYRPCATAASVLYFVLANLSFIDPMYQFSLESYISLFIDSIAKSKEKNPVWDSINERIEQLDKFHKYAVYTSTCRALFEKHKLLLSLQICVELKKLEGSIDLVEYDFFLRGGVVIGDVEQAPNPDPEWISREMWDNITELNRSVPSFDGIESSMIVSKRQWKDWFQSPEPENDHLPLEWDAKANDHLKRMVLLRCLRPDRITFAVIKFIRDQLGPEYVEPPAFHLGELYKEFVKPGQITSPILFVLSPGVDPALQLQSLATEKGKDIEIIPLGKGQDAKAYKAFKDASEKGSWVYLANCHLALSWMPMLEELIEKLMREGANEDFMLWLSSDPNPKIPISILQRCTKITTEPPNGIKANMLRMYSQVSENQFTKVKEEAKYKKLLFSLCWFHSILVERKKFKTLGWNVVYSFNNSDYEVSEHIISIFLGAPDSNGSMEVDPKNLPWDAIRYLIAEVSYGGRVTDDRDRRLLMVYAEECFNQKAVDEPKYKLVPNSQYYYIPDDSTAKGPQEAQNRIPFFTKFIKEFPSLDKPEAFGQHVNAQISSQISDSRDLLNSVLMLAPQSQVTGVDTVEQRALKMCTELLEKIPEPLNLAEIKNKWRFDTSPIKVVLVHEISRYNRLLEFSRHSLEQLSRGIQGLEVISPELEAMMHMLSGNKIPNAWQFAYASLKPLSSWIRDLEDRILQLKKWAYGIPPVVFWISGLTYPTGFTTALLQQAAEMKKCAIDSLSLDCTIEPRDEGALTVPPKEGAYIKGLYLEGAKWNYEENCLMEPEPMELTCPMPIIHMKAIKDKKKTKIVNYQCPCYYYSIRCGTMDRPSFMFFVDLKCGEMTPEFWVKRGAALLMNLDT